MDLISVPLFFPLLLVLPATPLSILLASTQGAASPVTLASIVATEPPRLGHIQLSVHIPWHWEWRGKDLWSQNPLAGFLCKPFILRAPCCY